MTGATRLAFLLETVDLECKHLQATAGRLFARPFDEARARGLRLDIDDAERTEAFVGRFARLQDTVGDKLLPAYLAAVAEPVSAAIDNFDRAERLGLLRSADEWVAARKLRNRMVHEYVRDPTALAEALNQGYRLVPLLVDFSQSILQDCRRRGLSA